MTRKLTGEALTTAALDQYGEIAALVALLERRLAARRTVSPETKAKLEVVRALVAAYREELTASGLLSPEPTPHPEHVH